MLTLFDAALGAVGGGLGVALLCLMISSVRRNRVRFWRVVILAALAGGIAEYLNEPPQREPLSSIFERTVEHP
jgi:hypothetical protein